MDKNEKLQDIRLEPMQYQDIMEIVKIEKEEFGAEAWSECMIADLCDSFYDRVYVLRKKEKILGYIAFRILGEISELLSIAIRKEWKSQGLATRLMQQWIKDISIFHVERAFLEVRAGNQIAIHLYQKFGFIEISIRKEYYQNPKEDAIVMRKEIIYPKE